MIEICENGVAEDIVAERRLWMAVIVHAVEDWLSDKARIKRAAEKFLFEEDDDFTRSARARGSIR